ncbi:type II toxin-antitoxin system RelE/ParE family toxin [Bifidobacterium aerophilum]|uniref:Type II toxin-antitoxin system RelE/ParE family toxin n=1 Tax=Bifidobacterium aerophilum TaxID=1798155 RepID=A0A6N9Z785_9BIFI|nr:type II toxin-antitoxin system RelE/ParE family toxin [Bifidobacterium aerophilum]
MERQWIVDTTYIDDWLDQQDDATVDCITAAIDQLALYGPALKRPLVGQISGSRFINMKEPRPPSTGRSEIRILFAFDPERRAIMLLAGDKANADRIRRARLWNRWYDDAIPQADLLFERHLRKLQEGVSQ